MNYLAHLFLSDETPDMLVGGLLGDFVKGQVGDRYGAEISRGIALHRKVDAFTDLHQAVVTSRRRVSPVRRRFAGIMVDVFYDHFLARHWDDYSAVPLVAFAGQVYEALAVRCDILPDRLRQALPYMVRDNWLVSYRDRGVVGLVLDGIARRLRRANTLPNAAEELESHYAHFEADFRAFFPDLIAFVAAYKQCRER